MVEATRPVDGDLRLVGGQFSSGVEGGASVEGGILVEAFEDGAVVADVVALGIVALGGDKILRCYSEKG